MGRRDFVLDLEKVIQEREQERRQLVKNVAPDPIFEWIEEVMEEVGLGKRRVNGGKIVHVMGSVCEEERQAHHVHASPLPMPHASMHTHHNRCVSIPPPPLLWHREPFLHCVRCA